MRSGTRWKRRTPAERTALQVRRLNEQLRVNRERFDNASLVGSIDQLAKELGVSSQVVVDMLGWFKFSRAETEDMILKMKRAGFTPTHEYLMGLSADCLKQTAPV